tara:strand:- start:1398 stop:2873 length:1476 start_codon:yes stop_codon:yes gene_type:complete
MARNVTNGIGRIGSKTGGGGGSGKIVTTNPFTRSTGITTDGNNNIIKVTLGEHVYSSIQYNAVGLITGYNENIDDTMKGFSLTYNASNLVTNITVVNEHPAVPAYSTLQSSAGAIDEGGTLTFTLTTEDLPDSTILYWDTSSDADVDTTNGSFTVTSNSGTFQVTITNDTTTEGSETITARVYSDSGRTVQVIESSAVTINDTSIGSTVGTQSNPAVNAKEIYDSAASNNRTNGYYWIKGNGTVASARQFYCILDSAWGSGGGWMVIANHDAQKYANTSGSNHQPRPTCVSSFTGADGQNSHFDPTPGEMKPETSFSCDMTDIPYQKVMQFAYGNSGMQNISTQNWLGNPQVYWCSSFSTTVTMPQSNAWSQQFNGSTGLSLSWGGTTQTNLRHCYSSSDFDCEGWGVWNPNSGPAPYRNGSNNSAQYDPVYVATWQYNVNSTMETLSWHDTSNYGYDDWQDGSGQSDQWYVGNTGSKQNARDKPSMLLVQ